MAIYAGETVRVYGEALDWDDTPLVPAAVEAVTVIIANSDGDLVVEDEAFEYLPEEGRWLYAWDSPEDPGNYAIEMTVATPEGDSKDVRRVTLSAPRNQKVTRDSYYLD